MVGPFRWVWTVFDCRDERRARALRESYGKRLRLLSWVRDSDGRWRARLSGPGVERTLERTGRSRARAAESAAVAMDRLLIARYTLGPHLRRAPDSKDDGARPGRLGP